MLIQTSRRRNVVALERELLMLQGRVLIADDDAVVRLDLRTMLTSLGHTIVGECDNGQAAVYMARNLKPDLVILDIMMPKMNGLDAAEVIGKERLGPVIMLTAFSDVAMIEKANRAGVLGYLVKPFREQELKPAVEIAISRYREMIALEYAVSHAENQLETSRVVGRAKRVLMDKYVVGDQEAYRRLNAQALATNRTLKDISEAIILAEEISSPIADGKRR